MEKKEDKKVNATEKVEKVNNANAVELQKEIDRKTAELKRCLEELTRKRAISENRVKFIEALDKLQIAKENIEENDTFEISSYKLTFFNTEYRYQDNAIFNISNRVILLKFIEFIKVEIDKKVAELESELIA